MTSFIARLAKAIRELFSPSYRPELHYMRGPGPAYARRTVLVEARPELPRLRRKR